MNQVALSIVNQAMSGATLIPYEQCDRSVDYKAFCVLLLDMNLVKKPSSNINEGSKDYRMLLLHCTRKASKGPHYQLPGGHVDLEDMDKTKDDSLYEAGRIAAAREVLEETGLNLTTPQLSPLILQKEKPKKLPNLFKDRLYYVAILKPSDLQMACQTALDNGKRLQQGQGDDSSFRLPISHEHSGFYFERDWNKAITEIELHSGGKNSKALNKAITAAASFGG